MPSSASPSSASGPSSSTPLISYQIDTHAAGQQTRARGSSSSGRRVNPVHSYGSASRRNEVAATGSLRRTNNSSSEKQAMSQSFSTSPKQSATSSAVSMMPAWSDARKMIRRESRLENHLTNSPLATLPRDADADAHAHADLTFTTDLAAMKDMLFEAPVLSAMLLCIPLGIAAKWFSWGDSLTFIFNFLAIIPLAWLLGNATEEIALRSNQTLGGLLNATFGNAVELIVSIIALKKGFIKLVQTSLLGSILSNLLLVLGMSFFLGGLKYSVQSYNQQGAHMFSSLLLLAATAIVLPATFVNSFDPKPPIEHLLIISRITALIMFVIYVLYLFFQLYTHSEMFEDGEFNPIGDEDVKTIRDDGDLDQILEDTEDRNSDSTRLSKQSDDDDDDEEDEPQLTLFFSVVLLVAVTLFVSLCSEYLVDSIKDVTRLWHLNESFVGIILIPIVGNAAEHATAVTVAMKNKMDLAIGVAIGSSTQIALFLIPFITLLGWVMNEPMTLNFSIFETIVLVMSVLIVNFLVKNGESNWLQGLMLIAAYGIIATAFLWHPETPENPLSPNIQ